MNFLSWFATSTQLFFACSGQYTSDWSPVGGSNVTNHDSNKETASLMLDVKNRNFEFKPGDVHKASWGFSGSVEIPTKDGICRPYVGPTMTSEYCGEFSSSDQEFRFAYRHNTEETGKKFENSNYEWINGQLDRLTGHFSLTVTLINWLHDKRNGSAYSVYDMTCKKTDKPLF
jgi:hypothetical protein